jgi:hypothetical protein
MSKVTAMADGRQAMSCRCAVGLVVDIDTRRA